MLKVCSKYIKVFSEQKYPKNPGFFSNLYTYTGEKCRILNKTIDLLFNLRKKIPKYLMQLCVKEGWSHSMFVKLVSHWKKEREESKCVKRGVFIPYFLLHGRKYYKNVPLNNCIFFVSFRRPHELQLGDFNARHHIHWGRKKCLFT